MSDALKDLARELGMSEDDLRQAAERAAAKRRGDELARAPKPPAPLASEDKAPSRWNDDAAAQQWLDEEANDPDGILGLGGQTAGGIFGAEAIATEGYDPAARMRGESRAATRMNAAVNVEMLRTLNDLRKELGDSRAEAARLRAADEERKRLTEGPGRRRRRWR